MKTFCFRFFKHCSTLTIRKTIQVRILTIIKTLKDFAELSTDEIVGGYDEIKGKREKFDGVLEEFNIPRKDAEDLIMRARKKVFNF